MPVSSSSSTRAARLVSRRIHTSERVRRDPVEALSFDPGANDPGFYTVHLRHIHFRALSRGGLAEFVKKLKVEQERKELEAREKALADKIIKGKALLAERKKQKDRQARVDAQGELYGSDDDGTDSGDDASGVDDASALTGPGESLSQKDHMVAADASSSSSRPSSASHNSTWPSWP